MNLRTTHLPLAALALMVAAGPVLRAEDTKYGLQFGLASATGSVTDQTGIKNMAGIGLHMVVPIAEGQAIRPRLEVWSGSREKTYNFVGQSEEKVTTTFSTTLLGADYLYFLNGTQDRGPYLLAGVGLSSNHAEVKDQQDGTSSTWSGTATKPAIALGAGYQLGRSWGLEARYGNTTFKDSDTGMSSYINTVSFSATFRFN